MAILKNAKKKIKSIKKKKNSNHRYLINAKNAVKDLKKVIEKGDKDKAKELLNPTFAKLDKAKKKGVFHQNKVDRYKKKLSKSVNQMK